MQSIFPSPILTVASSPACRFLRQQIRYFGVGVSLSIFQCVVTHTVQGCFVLSEGELRVLLEFSSFICDPADVGNLLLSSSAFSKSRLSVLKFLVHLPLKTWRLWTFLFQYVRWVLLLVVWTFFDMPFLWDRNESWTLPVVWPMLSFPSMLAYWISTFTTSSFRIWNSSAGIPSPFLALFLLVVP